MSEYINDPNRITFLGNIDYRNKQIKFGIKAHDRTRHLYVIGKSGMGKSTLLENMAIQDIQNGEGLAIIDPHGSMAEKLLNFIPEERKKDVVYFNPSDTEFPIALNVLERVDPNKRHLVADGLMAAFKKAFGEDRFSDRIQYILNNILLTLLENEDQTLMGVNRILNDKAYRKRMVANVKDPSVKAFWEEEYEKAGAKYQQEAAPGIQNKIGQFTSNPLIRNIIGQKKTSFDIREIMDNRKILIMNLSKGNLGVGNANLIGSLLITKIYLAAMGRADINPYEMNKLPTLYFYVDEFQNFANDSFADILSEARKYKLALTVAHQYIDQLTDEIKSAIFGNVGTMITFRVGAADAEVFEKEFAPVFTADDIVNLSAYQIYLRLMIDNVSSKPFSANALPPIDEPEISYASEIIELSRQKYGKQKSQVEEEIKEWFGSEHENIRSELTKNKNYPTPNMEINRHININTEHTQNIQNIQQVKNTKEFSVTENRDNNKEYREEKREREREDRDRNNSNHKHTRSRREHFRESKDLPESTFKIVDKREKAQNQKAENNNSLKDAILKAIHDENKKLRESKFTVDEQKYQHNEKQQKSVTREEVKTTEKKDINLEDRAKDKTSQTHSNNQPVEIERDSQTTKLSEVPEKILRSVVED